jgi:DNA-binding NarL/FixJ family response regulator
MKITVFLADAHAAFRDGLRFLLEADSSITVVGTAPDGRQAVHQVIQLQPNIVIMDIKMPELNGIEATYQICHTCPSTRVVILSMYATLEHVILALQSGARGYLMKESAGTDVINAIRTIVAGGHYLNRKISDMLIDDFVSQCNAKGVISPWRTRVAYNYLHKLGAEQKAQASGENRESEPDIQGEARELA